ncbi:MULTISPECIES: hypothetical protein [Pseudoalteromonas]|uniref:Uncharacterized protein n=1 Tax=Pseudoalteromonas peptidolytica F12-50-A1 TaxID=1315280 RepID=A0A8I0T2E8_9GAMM|nr:MULTISPECIES: hypothetical protein [Pseudoalteromonas]MBE0344940.1 hypothetical protein [Pseudoalteromonas peptidolytica F12-50-A1]GEK08338.1 hypothetical protein PPE03_05870 [Pseudoalteromonas peptidolytica]
MSINKLKEIAQKQKINASKEVLQIMRTQGCSSCCSFSEGGNSQEARNIQ